MYSRDMETINTEELAKDVVFDETNGWPVVSDDDLVLRFDDETGLPVVPPGFFWQVGDHFKPGWRGAVMDMGPCVKLMMLYQISEIVPRIVTKKTFFGGIKEVSRTEVTKVERHVCVHKYENLQGRRTWKRDEAIPESAVNISRIFNQHTSLGFTEYRYDLPLTKYSILYLAKEIFEEFAKEEQGRIEKAEEDRKRLREAAEVRAVIRDFKEEFYGNYPPKSL